MAYPENTSPPNPYDLVGKPCVWTWNFAGSRGLQTVVLSFRRSNSFGAPSYACSLAIARFAYKTGGKIRLRSRNDHDFGAKPAWRNCTTSWTAKAVGAAMEKGKIDPVNVK